MERVGEKGADGTGSKAESTQEAEATMKTSRGYEFSEVIERLYVGSTPEHGALTRAREGGYLEAPINVLVAVAKERPIHAGHETDIVLFHTSLKDDVPTQGEYQRAGLAAQTVFNAYNSGDHVLVTCLAGINRSSFVAAWAMKKMGYSAEQAIKLIRRARGSIALSNPYFEALIKSDEHTS